MKSFSMWWKEASAKRSLPKSNDTIYVCRFERVNSQLLYSTVLLYSYQVSECHNQFPFNPIAYNVPIQLYYQLHGYNLYCTSIVTNH
jgi:hypothetical protein